MLIFVNLLPKPNKENQDQPPQETNIPPALSARSSTSFSIVTLLRTRESRLSPLIKWLGAVRGLPGSLMPPHPRHTAPPQLACVQRTLSYHLVGTGSHEVQRYTLLPLSWCTPHLTWRPSVSTKGKYDLGSLASVLLSDES